MRRILWNIYAWPISFIFAVSFFQSSEASFILQAIDTLMNILALIGLHLHIWDKNLIGIPFWKSFSFVFIIWDFGYNILLRPLNTGESFDPGLLFVPVILSPLYIALFRYGFRKWNNSTSLDDSDNFTFISE